jgi:HAD superfamily hydrolase (TIGR01549 family)
MRILYYLEPYVELGQPLFRMGTIRNHLNGEIASLQRSNDETADVRLICSEHIAREVRHQNHLPGIPLIVVTQRELRRVYGNYLEASEHWYNGTYSSRALEKMTALLAAKLKGFDPDVILCYESNAPFLRVMFPRALFLNNTLGIFSRAPYPETSCLDPFGIGKDSFLVRYADQIRGVRLSQEQRQRILQLKHAYRESLLRYTPVSAEQVRQGFERVVLLPLQVSRYFMFSYNCPEGVRFDTQLDFLSYTLERIPREIGVFVTMHGAEAKLMTPRVLKRFKTRYPNFLYSAELQQIRWVSQHLLPHVHGVVSLSSSVGLQTLLWDIPLFAVGRSQLQGLSFAPIERVGDVLGGGAFSPLDGAFHYLLTHYYPLLERYHHDPHWFYPFLRRGIDKHRRGAVDFEFFEPIDDEPQLFDALREELRVKQLRRDLTRSVPNLSREDETSFSSLYARIASADVISFDVFDTLITRKLADPKAVFELVGANARSLLEHAGVDPYAFGQLRQEAARHASEQAARRGGEEYQFADVYDEIAARLSLSPQDRQRLLELELEIERRVHVTRSLGREAFEEARRRGKKIILISDTYLPTAFVRELLASCGYDDIDALYVSSEHDALKKTGRLYEIVKREHGMGTRFLHLGDNHYSDVIMARRAGWEACHLPNITDRYVSSSLFGALWKPSDLNTSLGAAIHHGVVSRAFYDESPPVDSWFAGSAYRLGYEAGGPLVAAYANWVLEQAVHDGVDHLYFLARDGYLVKQAYDLLVAGRPGAPRSHYLLASRRAYAIAALRSPEDIRRSLSWRFSACPLKDFLLHRFDMTPEDLLPGSVREAGFRSVDDQVQSRGRNEGKLRALLLANSDRILAAAAREREPLLDYFRGEGLYEPSRRYIVDLGHNATLQRCIGRMTGRSDLGGYYFATFFGAKAVFNEGYPISSYLLSFERNEASNQQYCRNIGMFEFLFLPPLPSFKRFVRRPGGDLEPEYVAGDEEARSRVIEQVHQGVLDFCGDVVTATAGASQAFDIPSNDALRTYVHFITRPHRADAAMLAEVSFVDAFGGSLTRYLIEPLPEKLDARSYDQYRRRSWWRKGAEALALGGEETKAKRKPRWSEGTTRGKWQRKIDKLRRDPTQFVADMRVLRTARRLLNGLRSREP